MPWGMKLEAIMGMPMPRLAYIPSLNSRAARRTMFSRILAAAEPGLSEVEPPGVVRVNR